VTQSMKLDNGGQLLTPRGSSPPVPLRLVLWSLYWQVIQRDPRAPDFVSCFPIHEKQKEACSRSRECGWREMIKNRISIEQSGMLR
jgi:hypothetical protein